VLQAISRRVLGAPANDVLPDSYGEVLAEELFDLGVFRTLERRAMPVKAHKDISQPPPIVYICAIFHGIDPGWSFTTVTRPYF
jgi:hypothetical protein